MRRALVAALPALAAALNASDASVVSVVYTGSACRKWAPGQSAHQGQGLLNVWDNNVAQLLEPLRRARAVRVYGWFEATPDDCGANASASDARVCACHDAVRARGRAGTNHRVESGCSGTRSTPRTIHLEGDTRSG